MMWCSSSQQHIHTTLEIKNFSSFYPFICGFHFKDIGVNLKIMLGCCVILARVVTFAMKLSRAPYCSLNSAERLVRVAKLMKRIMLAHSASFMS